MLAKQTSARRCWLLGTTDGWASTYAISGRIEMSFTPSDGVTLRSATSRPRLGALWAILQPLLTMIVFTSLFGTLARLPSEGQPYAIFSYAGLLPWNFVAAAVTTSSNSLVNSTNLITKVYFPRLLVPTAAVAAALVDLAIASLVRCDYARV